MGQSRFSHCTSLLTIMCVTEYLSPRSLENGIYLCSIFHLLVDSVSSFCLDAPGTHLVYVILFLVRMLQILIVNLCYLGRNVMLSIQVSQ